VNCIVRECVSRADTVMNRQADQRELSAGRSVCKPESSIWGGKSSHALVVV